MEVAKVGVVNCNGIVQDQTIISSVNRMYLVTLDQGTIFLDQH